MTVLRRRGDRRYHLPLPPAQFSRREHYLAEQGAILECAMTSCIIAGRKPKS